MVDYKFKVGQQVRYTGKSIHGKITARIGKEGRITDGYLNNFGMPMYRVWLNQPDDYDIKAYEDNLELVGPKWRI